MGDLTSPPAPGALAVCRNRFGCTAGGRCRRRPPSGTCGGQETGTWRPWAARCHVAVFPVEFRVSQASAPSQDLTGPLGLTFSETRRHQSNTPSVQTLSVVPWPLGPTTSSKAVVLLLESRKRCRACVYGPEVRRFYWGSSWCPLEPAGGYSLCHDWPLNDVKMLIPSLHLPFSFLGRTRPCAGRRGLCSPCAESLLASGFHSTAEPRAAAIPPAARTPACPAGISVGRPCGCLSTFTTPQGAVFCSFTISSLLCAHNPLKRGLKSFLGQSRVEIRVWAQPAPGG